MTMSSGYVSVGGNRSGGDSFLPRQSDMAGGGAAQISINESDHVKWAWGAFDERPRDLNARAHAARKRQTQVKVQTPGEQSDGHHNQQAGTGSSSSGVAAASLSLVQHQAMTQSEVRNDLLDVLRMISSGSVAIQTEAPSMTRSQRMVQLEHGGASRSIALQCGITKQQNNASTQCTESEVLGTMIDDTTEAVEQMLEASGGQAAALNDGDDGELTHNMSFSRRAGGGSFGGTKDKGAFSGSTLHSRHLPNSDIPADSFPSYLAEAKQLGVCNRYGFISMPKPPFMLPPRRSVKTVDPSTVTHLFAKHNCRLDDATSGRLSRTLQLWTQGSGFVPKF